jgi:hypothetical protein
MPKPTNASQPRPEDIWPAIERDLPTIQIAERAGMALFGLPVEKPKKGEEK